MSFTLLGFSAVRILATDVAKSRDWYAAFFGLPPKESLPNFASFSVGGITLEIVAADEKTPHRPEVAWVTGEWTASKARSSTLKALGLKHIAGHCESKKHRLKSLRSKIHSGT